jgi:hypothetical protein
MPAGRLHKTVTLGLWQELDEAARERLKSLSLDVCCGGPLLKGCGGEGRNRSHLRSEFTMSPMAGCSTASIRRPNERDGSRQLRA